MFPTHNVEVRIALMQAADEARALGHGPVGADHLLLGFLSNLRGTSQRVLAEHGVTYAEARQRVIATRGTGQEGAHVPSVEDDREALGAIGIDLDRVREAVLDNFGEDITEDWGERGRGASGRSAGRGQPRAGRGSDSSHGRPRGRGRGRRGPRSGRFGPAVDETLRQVFHDLRASIRPDRSWSDERPSREEVARLRRSLDEGLAALVLLAILKLEDPVVATALGEADRDAIIRELDAELPQDLTTA